MGLEKDIQEKRLARDRAIRALWCAFADLHDVAPSMGIEIGYIDLFEAISGSDAVQKRLK